MLGRKFVVNQGCRPVKSLDPFSSAELGQDTVNISKIRSISCQNIVEHSYMDRQYMEEHICKFIQTKSNYKTGISKLSMALYGNTPKLLYTSQMPPRLQASKATPKWYHQTNKRDNQRKARETKETNVTTEERQIAHHSIGPISSEKSHTSTSSMTRIQSSSSESTSNTFFGRLRRRASSDRRRLVPNFILANARAIADVRPRTTSTHTHVSALS